MQGIFTYIDPYQNQLNVGKYTIYGSYDYNLYSQTRVSRRKLKDVRVKKSYWCAPEVIILRHVKGGRCGPGGVSGQSLCCATMMLVEGDLCRRRGWRGILVGSIYQLYQPTFSSRYLWKILQFFWGETLNFFPKIWGLPTLETPLRLTNNICPFFHILPIAFKHSNARKIGARARAYSLLNSADVPISVFEVLMTPEPGEKLTAWNPGPSGTDHF